MASLYLYLDALYLLNFNKPTKGGNENKADNNQDGFEFEFMLLNGTCYQC